MGKWMSAAVVVVLVGCGIEPGEPLAGREREQAPVTPGQSVDPVLLLSPTIPAVAPLDRVELKPSAAKLTVPREQVDLSLTLTNVPPQSGQVRVVLGQMGCGFSGFASGAAAVVNGAAHFEFVGEVPANMGWIDVIVVADNGDGQCTETDLIWTGQLATTDADLISTLDLSTLEPGQSWLCFAFNN